MRIHYVLAATAAAALAAALPARAEGNAQAQITDVKITLVDLDPGDGIAPAISFASGGYLSSWITAPGAAENKVQTDFASGAAGQVLRSDGSHSVFLTLLPGDLLGPGGGPGATANHSGAGIGGVAGEAQLIFSDFTLTPHTRLEITAVGSASTTGYPGTGGDYGVWAGAGVNIFSRSLQASLSNEFINAFSSGAGTTSQSGRLQASYDNIGDQAFTATISAVAYAGAAVNAAPVPEPSSWALLATGLLGLALRRRLQPARLR